jgi:probable addiction module antidote protein
MKLRISKSAKYRDKPEAIAKYLNDVLWTKDTVLIMDAIRAMVHAQGMTRFSRNSGIPRDVLRRAFDAEHSPSFDTVLRMVLALGVKITAAPPEKLIGED